MTRRLLSRSWLLYLLIGCLALLPRVWDLGGFITIDEANFWLRRSEIFLGALQSGNYAATALSAHPGVTTMWLGSIGIVLRRALLDWGLLSDLSFPTRLALLRLPLALAHTAAILAGYGLLRRLLPPGAAALAALLWALDPFVIGYSRLLHTDALAASFATVSMLAALLALRAASSVSPQRHKDTEHSRGETSSHTASVPLYLRGEWSPRCNTSRITLIIVSGICAGLAVLSKLPALALAPAVALAALLYGWDRQHLLMRLRAIGMLLAIWSTALALTVVVLWPALWVDIGAAIHALREGVEVEGGQPHMMGNFFLGREVAAPGPLFYPMALALRLTPWALLGLLGLALPVVWRQLPALSRRDLALLAAFVLIFIVAMTLFPKKFNRYAVPAFPALDILAACGLVAIYDLRFVICDFLALNSLAANRSFRAVDSVALALFLLFPLSTLAQYHPYYIAYFNPLLGGGAAGARTFVVGWGEGYEQVAAWLNQQPDISGVLTVSNMTPTLQPYLRQGAQSVAPRSSELPDKAGYVVVYIEQVQRGLVLPPFDQFYGRATPLHSVRVGGIEYAWIYQAPPPVAQPRPADFGQAIYLRGITHGPTRPGQPLALDLFWEARGRPAADYLLFVHLLGPDGQRYAQADLAPGGEQAPTTSWQAGRFFTTKLQLPLAETLPPGDYRLISGLYDPSSGQRLPLAPGQGADPALDGPDALLLTTLTIN